MRWTNAVFATVLPVLGKSDECADFCFAELGKEMCSNGSYCKNGRYCHALFWTGFENSRICVFVGGRECPTVDPVECSQARSEVDRITASLTATTPSATSVTTTLSHTTVSVTESSALSPTTAPTAATTDTEPEISMSRTGSVERMLLLRDRDRSFRTGYGVINVHHSNADDMLPRVSVRFLGGDDRVAYSVLLDTGSDLSCIRRQNPQSRVVSPVFSSDEVPWRFSDADAPWGDEVMDVSEVRVADSTEGYYLGGRVPTMETDEELAFGHEGLVREIAGTERIHEMVELVSPGTGDSFALSVDILLTSHLHSLHVGVGVLGAGPNSELARSAAFFTLVPHPVNQLLIGERDADRLSREVCNNEPFVACAMETRDVPLDTSTGLPMHWVVWGQIHVDSPLVADLDAPRAIRWIVDSGAGHDGGHFVDDYTYAVLVAGISFTGAVVDPYTAGIRTVVSECTEDRIALFPSFTLVVGDGLNQLSVQMDPIDYLIRPPLHPDFCYLKVNKAGVPAMPYSRLLGMGFLSRVVTIFDIQLRRVSFCKRSGPS